jgi:magnesium chelatase family protein
MSSDQVDKYCTLSTEAEILIKKAFEVLHLSMRGYHKILRVARTIADLESANIIEAPHIQEAIMYRSLDQSLEQHRQ